jgi:hypothetical protein
MTKRAGICLEQPDRLLFLRKALRACLLSCGLATLCYGSAFSVSELGARATGMGTAFLATADDGSALFFNPAGIAFQPGTHLEMDNAVVVGLFRFTPSATPVGQVVPPNGYSESIRPHFIPLAFMYATKQISPKMTFGFGLPVQPRFLAASISVDPANPYGAIITFDNYPGENLTLPGAFVLTGDNVDVNLSTAENKPPTKPVP